MKKTKWDNQGIGQLTKQRLYPINFEEAKIWLDCFLKGKIS